MANARIVNPHYPSAPLRMADGRLFTDYRPNCSLLLTGGSRQMKAGGESAMRNDRGLAVRAAGQTGVVDTMVPELYKSVYTWNGGVRAMSHPVGIGTGRLYLPGRAAELIGADPDAVAVATFPEMGTVFPSYVEGLEPAHGPVSTVRRNRYSAPHA